MSFAFALLYFCPVWEYVRTIFACYRLLLFCCIHFLNFLDAHESRGQREDIRPSSGVRMLAWASPGFFNTMRLVSLCVFIVPLSPWIFAWALINLCVCLYFRFLRYHPTTLLPQAIVLNLIGLALAFGCLNFGKEGYLLVALAFLNISVSLSP